MSDLVTEIASMPPSNEVRVGTVTAVDPVVLDIGGGPVSNAGTLGRLSIGQTVACIRQGDTWLVLGQVNSADGPVWTDLTLNGDWTPLAQGYLPPGWCIDSAGFVCLRGIARRPTVANIDAWTEIARVPEAIAPSGWTIFPCPSGRLDMAGQVTIGPAGEVLVIAVDSGYVSFDAVRYMPGVNQRAAAHQ